MPDYHHPVCPCGSLRFIHRLVMFPLHWSSKCARCGRPHLECKLKIAKSKPVKRVPNDPYRDTWGGF